MCIKIVIALVFQLRVKDREKPIAHFRNEKVGIITVRDLRK